MWAQIINAILGIWLMASPALLQTSKTAADNNHIVGPLIVSFAVISWWESTRVVRLYNLPLGVWLLVAPWVLGFDHTAVTANSLLVGALVIFLSRIKGTIKEQFGGGWSAAFTSDSAHARAARENPPV